MSLTPNLTRDQAAERAGTFGSRSYRIDLDLTDGAGGPGEKTFATRCRDPLRRRAEGADTFVDFVGDGIASATLNGRPLDVGGWTNAGGLALTDLAADNELVVDAVGLYTNTGEGLHRFVDPVDGAVYLYSQFETADAKRLYRLLRPAGPEGDVHRHGDRPGRLAGGVQRRRRPRSTDGPRPARAVHHFATTEPMSTYVTALIAGPYHVVRDHHDGIDLGIFCRVHAGRAPGRRAALRRDQAGLRLLPPALRRPVPVRQVRPAVRARVQRRRDGERRRGHVPRGVRLPLQGDPLPVRAPLRDDPARDGPHVVRRSGHHALVGRPVAQRVVRHLGVGGRAGARHRVHQRLDHVRQRARSPGPTSRTSCPPPIRSPPTWSTWPRSR